MYQCVNMFMYIQYGSNATLSFLWKLENLLKICSINIPTASNSHLLQLYFPLYSLLSYSIGGANNMFPPPTKVLKASLANQSYYSHPTHQQKMTHKFNVILPFAPLHFYIKHYISKDNFISRCSLK